MIHSQFLIRGYLEHSIYKWLEYSTVYEEWELKRRMAKENTSLCASLCLWLSSSSLSVISIFDYLKVKKWERARESTCNVFERVSAQRGVWFSWVAHTSSAHNDYTPPPSLPSSPRPCTALLYTCTSTTV